MSWPKRAYDSLPADSSLPSDCTAVAWTVKSVSKPASGLPPVEAGTLTVNVPSDPAGTALPSPSNTELARTDTVYVPLSADVNRPCGAAIRYEPASVGCTPGSVSGERKTAVVEKPLGPVTVRSCGLLG